jgi:hypothetical protein
VQFVVDGSKSGARIADGASGNRPTAEEGPFEDGTALRRSSDICVGIAGALMLRGRR